MPTVPLIPLLMADAESSYSKKICENHSMSNKALGPRAAALHEAIKEVAAYERGEVKLNTIEVGMNTQPKAHWFADRLTRGMSDTATREHAAALLRTQHADIERKDALLRQALVAMTAYASTHGSVAAVRDARDSSIEAIRKELQ